MDQDQTKQVANVAENMVENAVPVLSPFAPLIQFVSDFAIEHFVANGSAPTEAQIMAAVPVDLQALIDGWASYVPSGDGSLNK